MLVVCLLGLGSPGSRPAVRASAAQDQGNAAASQPQAQPAQTAGPAPAPPAPQPQNSTSQAKPSPKHQAHPKKTGTPDCSNSATPLNPAVGGNSTDSTNAGSANAGSPDAASPAAKPCPPPKVVIRNGGSEEPTVQLKGGTTTEQASQQRSTTEQLTAATEENLKKIAGRQLTPSQQEMVDQVKQFTAQSKEALAAGDLERGHNLAVKARLLSDELVKP